MRHERCYLDSGEVNFIANNYYCRANFTIDNDDDDADDNDDFTLTV